MLPRIPLLPLVRVTELEPFRRREAQCGLDLWYPHRSLFLMLSRHAGGPGPGSCIALVKTWTDVGSPPRPDARPSPDCRGCRSAQWSIRRPDGGMHALQARPHPDDAFDRC